MTADQLHQAEARYQRAFRRAETEREARNRAVRDAVAAGWTHAQIADATGLTRARVGQIALMRPALAPTADERPECGLSARGPL